MPDCGSCTLCCDLLPIPEINKPESTLCQDCTLGEGCNIWEKRPKACKDFECEFYKWDDDTPEELRPSNCDVIFEKVTDDIYLALCNWKKPNAWGQVVIKNQIDKYNKEGISVIITSYTMTNKIVAPAPGKVAIDVMNEALKIYENEAKEF